jgi:neutral ceramidase
MSKVLKLSLAILIILLSLVIVLFAPISYKPLHEQEYYRAMMEDLDHLQLEKHTASNQLKLGWATINITPNKKMPMAGYGRRGDFKSVHDSLYIRILTIDNGVFKVHLINADLLLFPPDLKNALENYFYQNKRECEYLYFGATHTHNANGGWDDTHLGQLLMGGFDEDWLNTVSQQILNGIDAAGASSLSGKIAFWEAVAGDFVWNRLSNTSFGVDDYMRGVEIVREDSSKALFVTFSAHPTSIHSKNLELSADYPGALVNNLENNGGYDFAMFMAGAVGSHAKNGFCTSNFELCEEVGERLSERIIHSIQRSAAQDTITITASTIPVKHGKSQLRISKQLHFRDWFFKFMNGPLKADIRLLVLGDIVFIGTSNDFSGEILIRNQIPAYANIHGRKIIVSSFNGEYTGYITHDSHYKKANKQEVTLLNWVGPHFGLYYAEILKRIIDKLDD